MSLREGQIFDLKYEKKKQNLNSLTKSVQKKKTKKLRVLMFIGTRPEAIKMLPLFIRMKEIKHYFVAGICVTAQHRGMLDQILKFFTVKPDYDLNIMRPNQGLSELTARIILRSRKVLKHFKPDLVLVHGDTTTSMSAALASFYYGCKVGHVEAGLRTLNKKSPFPEEMNRQLTARLTDYHFAPTEKAMKNLLHEGVCESSIYITGNTVIDALLIGKKRIDAPEANYNSINKLKRLIDSGRRLILVTGHRRENFGKGLINICKALVEIAKKSRVQIIYPVHSNPNVAKVVNRMLGSQANVTLIKPQPYEAFLWLMCRAEIILTDSGGVQEEGPALGKPVLVMREITERPEALKAGTVLLVGTNTKLIVKHTMRLLSNRKLYDKMSQKQNPYGDGRACERITNAMIERLCEA